MDRPGFLVADRRRIMVNRLAQNVEDTAENFIADRNRDRSARINGLHATGKTIGRAHSDAAGHAVAEVLHDLDHEVDFYFTSFALDGDCIENLRQFARREFDIYDRSDDLYDFTFCCQW